MSVNVDFKKKDDLNATLTVNVTKADYEPRVENELKKYQKQAAVPGFRPGKAPFGMIKKMYGKNVMVDSINSITSEAMYSYLKDNGIDILAQPLLSEENSDVDFDKDEDFTFSFDLGLTPEFELNINEKDKLDYYKIKVDDKALDEEIDNLKKRYGRLEMTDDQPADEKDVIYAIVTELNEDGTVLEGGVENKKISLIADMVKDAKTKKALIGVKKGDTLNADMFKLFDGNETVIANTLEIPKEAVADLNKTFNLEIDEVRKFIEAEMNQELFDKVFGEGIVKTEEEFRTKVKENMEMYFQSESDHHLEHMLNHLVTDKHTFAIPDAFLKRWLIETKPEDYNAENIDEKFEAESNQLRYTLVQEKVVEQFNLEITPEEIEQTSISYAASMFRQYGIQNPDYESVKQMSDQQLKDERYMGQVRDMAFRRKMVAQLRELVTLKEKDITSEKFYKMLEDHNKEHNHGHSH